MSLLLLLAACTVDPSEDVLRQSAVAALLELEGDADQGEGVYAAACANCHGDDGEGSYGGPALAPKIPLMDDDVIVERVVYGYDSDQASAMPAQDHLSDQEVVDLLAWLRLAFDSEE